MFKKIVLQNGASVVLERIKFLDTVSVGFWFATGSADETKDVNGYCHFIEHMLFKGTKNKNARDIIKNIEGVGGIFNAFTSRHFTVFYISIVSSHIARAMDILIDVIDNSLFDEKEISREKRVVIEEIKMSNDAPEEIIAQQFFERAYKGTAMSFPIAGTVSNIKKVERSKICSHFKNKFHASNLVISVAGNFDIDYVENKLSYLKLKKNVKEKTKWHDASFKYATKVTERNDLNQVYFSFMMPTYKVGDRRNYNINVINDVFGGPSSSRLFQNLRENKGLCYNIYSHNSSFANGGIFEIHGSTSLEYYEYAFESIFEEIEILLKNKLRKEEIEEAKEMEKGAVAFNKMNTDFLMNKNAKNEYYYGKRVTFEKIYKNIDNVDPNLTDEVIEELFGRRKFFLSAVGPLGTKDKSFFLSEKFKIN